MLVSFDLSTKQQGYKANKANKASKARKQQASKETQKLKKHMARRDERSS